MKRYAVAILSFYDNQNKVFVVNGLSEQHAILEAMTQFTEKDNEFTKWCDEMINKSVDEIISHFFDGDISVSKPVLINS